MTDTSDQRHLTREGLEQYMAAGVPAVVDVSGTPDSVLLIDPADGTVAIRVDRQAGDAPDLEFFKHFVASTLSWQGRQWVEIRVAKGVDPFEAYPVLCAVLDRVQLEGNMTAPAVLRTLENYRELLAGLDRLSDEAETGLFGELLVLEHLIGVYGASIAVDAWCGPSAAEHDFCLPDYDLEVKTTTAEARHHWINDLAQLVPSPHRSLLLLSIQLTAGGAAGLRLPNLIDRLRAALPPDQRQRVDEALRGTYHWNASQSSIYRRVFRLRSVPGAYVVDAAFPAITPNTLAAAGLDGARFKKVRYQLDLSGLTSKPDTVDQLHTIGTSLP